MASLVLADSSQLTSSSQHLGSVGEGRERGATLEDLITALCSKGLRYFKYTIQRKVQSRYSTGGLLTDHWGSVSRLCGEGFGKFWVPSCVNHILPKPLDKSKVDNETNHHRLDSAFCFAQTYSCIRAFVRAFHFSVRAPLPILSFEGYRGKKKETDGVTYSFGVFYIKFLDYFKEGKGATAWIASILVGVTLCSGQ
uniref:Uncharacterized protein n=1 Tax=Timema shepardi TaxID=629360 RepID=A0A7R9G151_TIMSH|nr:unnamed protein product [Timema shepardi]